MIILCLIYLVLLIIVVGPYVGAFFIGVIYVTSLVVTAPAVHLFVGKDIKERDLISDKLEEAQRRYDLEAVEMYRRHLKDAEEHVNYKITLIFLGFILSVGALYIFVL